MNNCTFELNTSENGGAIAIVRENDASLTLQLNASTFTGNTANSGTDPDTTGQGGAVYSLGAVVNSINCAFNTNTSKNGGGVYVKNHSSDSGVILSNTRFTGNSVGEGTNPAMTGFGGAVYLLDTSATISNSSFETNTSKNGGALFVNKVNLTEATLTVTDSTFNTNSANVGTNPDTSGFGGGIYLLNTVVELINTTFTSNVAAKGGGGLHLTPSANSLINGCTVDSNTSAASGGGLYINNANNFVITSLNVTSNTANSGGGRSTPAKGGGIFKVGSGDLMTNGHVWSASGSTPGDYSGNFSVDPNTGNILSFLFGTVMIANNSASDTNSAQMSYSK